MTVAPPAGPDPFGTASIRESVLAAWSSLPARLTEDLNSEWDHAFGSYEDRLLVELAQNAADAAGAAGAPGALWLDLRDGEVPVLTASNPGAPLDASGVVALASLRASGKGSHPGTVGRYGVGFNAVLAVTDSPQIHSRSGSVGFSLERTRALVPGREDVPILRLPFPVEPIPVPAGYTTSVVLPLRDDATPGLRDSLAGLAAAPGPLLLGLPGLTALRITIDGEDLLSEAASRTVLDGWFIHREEGVTWAVPPPGTASPRHLHAPTLTDEPVGLPALLVTDVPLEPGRRRLRRGGEAIDMARRAGSAYAGLLEALARQGHDPAILATMLPTGLGHDWFDTELRQAAQETLPTRSLLPLPGEPEALVPPQDAVTLADPQALRAEHWRILAQCHAATGAQTQLVAAGPLPTALRTAVVGLDEVVQGVDATDPQAWVHQVGPLLELTQDTVRREELALLPVPLADGRVAHGARGVVLPEAEFDTPLADALAALGVARRVVHPGVVRAAAADPVLAHGLERLGIRPGSVADLLDSSEVRGIVEEVSRRTEDVDVVSEGDISISCAVLEVVAAAWQASPWQVGERTWLRELLLPDDEDEFVPAWSLLQPDSPLTRFVDPQESATLSTSVVHRLPAPAWRALGVADVPVVEEAADLDPDVVADDDPLAEIDGGAQWLAYATREAARLMGHPLRPLTTTLVRDLDLVGPDRIEDLLHWIDVDPAAVETRRALTTPTRIAGLRGGIDLPSHAGWWLGRESQVWGSVAPDSTWAGLLPVAPAWTTSLSPDLLAALGMRAGLDGLTPTELAQTLADLTAEQASITRLLALWRALADTDPQGTDWPDDAWALDRSGAPLRVPAEQAVVIDSPAWLQREDVSAVVVAPQGRAAALAAVLDLPTAEEVHPGSVLGRGQETGFPTVVREVLPAVTRWWEHDELRVDGVQVPWWVDASGRVHAETLTGLAAGAAWAAGVWHLRTAVEALLLGEADGRRLHVENSWHGA